MQPEHRNNLVPSRSRTTRSTSVATTGSWWTWIQAIAALATVVSAVLAPAALIANAATGSLYLNQSTDPHGGVWLKGTTDGTTTGPMDTSTAAPMRGTLTAQPATLIPPPAGWSFGHLWETDLPSGFCRVDTVNDANNAGATIQLYARPNAYTGAPASGGCISNGVKSSQPTLDPRRNLDGTFYVYTCDRAVFSQGCYRMTYDPGAELMRKSELLAGGFPTAGGQGINPFTTNLGHDGNLYVTSDLLPYIYRITNPNQAVGNQTVSIIARSNDSTRIRAATFACWDPFRGGNTGLPTCAQMAASGNPAPDLVLTQKTKTTVQMNPAACAGVGVDVTGIGGPLSTPACLPKDVPISVLAPMGAQTDGAWNWILQAAGANQPPTLGPAVNSNVIYITDSPGATSQVIRYTINTNTQDIYANSGVLPDDTVAQYSFAFSPTQSPDGRMFLGDDATAGNQPLAGHIYWVPAGAPADVLGAPGAPAAPPALASQKIGNSYGAGVTLPNDGVWLPGPAGTPGHLWIADSAAGFCRVDPPAAGASTGTLAALNPATCNTSTAKPGQPAFDGSVNVVYLPDNSGAAKGTGMIALTYDQNGTICGHGPESVCNPIMVDPNGALDGQGAHAAGIDLTSADHPVYVGFANRTAIAPTEIARVNNPLCATDAISGAHIVLGTTGAAAVCGTTVSSVDFIANATSHEPIFNITFVGPDLYNANSGGLDRLSNAKTCLPGQCVTTQLLNIHGPRGMATDGTNIFMAAPVLPAGCPPTCPAPGALTTPLLAYNIRAGTVTPLQSQAVLPDGLTLASFDVVDSLTVDPAGNLYVADDPSALGGPAGQGRIFIIPGTIGSLTITQTPPALTNKNTPTFAWTDPVAGRTFSCSLVLQSAVDSFTPCASPTTYAAQPDGAYRFVVKDSGGVQASALFTVDSTPPVVSITSNPPNPDTSSSATFAWSANEALSGYQCSFGLSTAAAAFSACTSPASYTGLTGNTYLFQVKGTDLAGNTSAASAFTFVVNPVTVGPLTPPAQTLSGLTTAQAGTSTTTSAAGPITASTSGVPVTISWPSMGNIDHYELQQSINGAAFTNVALPSPTATSITLNLKPSPTNNSAPATTYKFQVRTVDTAGNVSPFSIGSSFTVPDTDNSFSSSFNGSWSGVNISTAFGGSVQESSISGSTAQPANAAPATSLAWVSTLGPDRGKAQVKVDGQIVATVDLYSPTQTTAQVAWAINGLAPNVNHSIQIVAAGAHNTASTASKVDYDAILALK